MSWIFLWEARISVSDGKVGGILLHKHELGKGTESNKHFEGVTFILE